MFKRTQPNLATLSVQSNATHSPILYSHSEMRRLHSDTTTGYAVVAPDVLPTKWKGAEPWSVRKILL